MENTNNQVINNPVVKEKQPGFMPIFGFGVVVIVLLLIYTVFTVKNKTPGGQAVSVTGTNEPTTALKREIGSLELTRDASDVIYKVGDTINLGLSADSNNRDIYGFDVLIGYENRGFEFVGKTAVFPGFSLYSYDKEKHVSITGAKAISNTDKAVFKNTKIADITFKALLPGKYTFTILSSTGRETTKFVDNKTTILTPTVNSVAVEVR